MLPIKPSPLPENALLNRYAQQNVYTDCYRTEVTGTITHAQFVTAFYTTKLFKLERLILKWAVSKPCSDQEAMQLANGEIDQFAAWYVEERGEDQLLLCDFTNRTRSWLMVAPVDNDPTSKTFLYFGSAVTTRQARGNDSASFGFSLLIGFHQIYSVLLLFSARLRVRKISPN